MATAKKVPSEYSVELTLTREESEYLLVALGDGGYSIPGTEVWNALTCAGVERTRTAQLQYQHAYTHLRR